MNMILLSPHNDDAELFASFLCLGFRPLVIVCLRSEKQEADGISHETREAETACAMEVLDCDWAQWPVSDIKPDWGAVETLMREHEPGRVFAPAFEPLGHAHHNEIARLAERVYGAERICSYLTYTSAGKSAWGEPVPFEDEWVPLKLEALRCYQSQIAHPQQVAHFMRDWYEYVE